jgi:hypothetical protein
MLPHLPHTTNSLASSNSAKMPFPIYPALHLCLIPAAHITAVPREIQVLSPLTAVVDELRSHVSTGTSSPFDTGSSMASEYPLTERSVQEMVEFPSPSYCHWFSLLTAPLILGHSWIEQMRVSTSLGTTSASTVTRAVLRARMHRGTIARQIWITFCLRLNSSRPSSTPRASSVTQISASPRSPGITRACRLLPASGSPFVTPWRDGHFLPD